MAQIINNLSVGDKIEVPIMAEHQSRFGEKIVFIVVDKNHEGYPENSVTLMTEKIIQVMCFDACEPGTLSQGNNRYSLSNILQWMNSDADAGEWYSNMHSTDKPPSTAYVYSKYHPYDSWAGFLRAFHPGFIAGLLETTQNSVLASEWDTKGQEFVTSKMFLASANEVGFNGSNGIAEGTRLYYFLSENDRMARPSASCISNIANAIKNNYNVNSSCAWWLRSPPFSGGEGVRCVTAAGDNVENNAYDGRFGLRPLCNVHSMALVSDDKNSDGNYEFILSTKINFEAKMGDFENQPTATRVILERNGVLSTLEVCNNYNDEAPVWETAKEDKEYIFKNSTKTADKWAVGIHAVIDREETEDIYLNEPIVLVREGSSDSVPPDANKSLDECSWSEIKQISSLGLAPNYWSIGDCKTITVDGVSCCCFILGFNHNSNIEGDGIHFQIGKASLNNTDNYCFTDSAYNEFGNGEGYRINKANSNLGGWEDSYMRNTVCPSFLEKLSVDLQEVISPCIKYTDNDGVGTNTAAVVTPTEDKIWLLSEFEVLGKRVNANQYEQDYQKQYDYYAAGNSTIMKSFSTNNNVIWWSRSACYTSAVNFCVFTIANGSTYHYTAAYSYGFAPAFIV